VKPPSFEYADPKSLDDAVRLLEEHEFEAKILSGGQSLMPLLNMRLARPQLLIDLAKIPELDHVREDSGTLVVGGMARQRALELSPVVRERFPLVYDATMLIAHPQNRNQGTVGGSIAHADPAAELPALVMATDAEMIAVGPDGARTISAEDFFVTYLTTSMEASEILTEVRIPALAPNTGYSLQELARRHGDFALAGVIATVTLAGDGTIESGRVVLFGVGATPICATDAERMLAGEQPSEALFEAVAAKASADLDEPLSDVHASAEYRRALAGVMAKRALAEATARAAH
jgi:CO/xanthine dehydrogenase FAD-binding subunit